MVAKRGCGRWPTGFREDDTALLLTVLIHFLPLLSVSAGTVVMDNGIAQFSFSNPGGAVIGIGYAGMENLLEVHNNNDKRGYLDVNWNWPGQNKNLLDNVQGTKFSIIAQTEDNVEISFSRTWDNMSDSSVAPLIIDKRYIMRRDVQGLYSYAIFDHPQGWPGFQLGQARVVYRLNGDRFQLMAISDVRQRFMPTESDRASGKPLAYPEAVLLTSPSNPQFRGEVDDKYQYSSENQDYNLHGWISKDPVVGFWIISPSNEFRTGGPVKQQLTCHVGPTALNMFISAHYAGREIVMGFADGEPWKKVFGPFLVYLNSNPPQGLYSELWQDASRQLLIESRNWPYNFATSDDFPASSQRGTVTGQLLIRDRYVNENDIPAGTAYLGLAAPGDVGSWQTESKGYQFWTRADSSGNFKIENVRVGNYSLYGWVPGTLGDFKHSANVMVTPGGLAELGSLVYEPPRSGPTIWEIGIPDRTAAEFYVPDSSPLLTNKLLRTASNALSLTQSRAQTPFQGVMYDYIRLEGHPDRSS
ncbi:hypothetical protein SAY87_017152 [Trapa incisa]|uniref:Rhamnogalacturonan lyase domain-containing protein n=1 Tax=Trapa incisa TaxID=236973 RepID=A0AAN7L816_9MYRT|nr:hypothetical protein SAY87_017152 [Trapa incisa]